MEDEAKKELGLGSSSADGSEGQSGSEGSGGEGQGQSGSEGESESGSEGDVIGASCVGVALDGEFESDTDAC